ncbi:hypothetical protein ACIWOS_07540, partial [Avibacterium paragallinarum]
EVKMKLEQLNKFLYAAKTKKNEGYRSYFNEHYKLIQGFCVFSILKLFRPMERQRLVEISQSIINIFEQANYAKMQDVYMPKRGMYKAYWVELTESEIHKIEPKLAQLKLILQGNNQALFLAENQNKIDKVLNERQEYIDQQANLLFKEKLPRFLSSAFAKEAHALKKSIKRREYLFGSAIVFFAILLFGVDKSHYFNYLPMLFPIVWGLWFLTKKLNEDKYLYHEYKHKEVLAKTYLLYSKQIDQQSYYFFDEEDNRTRNHLSQYLLQETTKQLAHNPAKTLGKTNKDNPYGALMAELAKKLNRENN